MISHLKFLTLAGLLLQFLTGFAQNPGFPPELYSRPERTQFSETSLHTDVMAFCQTLSENSAWVHMEIMGNSYEGKELPLMVLANPRVETPEQALSSGKPVYYIQGNIHGGEVEGKEALLILMREIAFEQKEYLLDQQILLFCPLFNPDGNDKLGANNRYNQDGSPYLAGQRANGQGYDLNRDGLKLETYEGKALAENVMKKWNPLLFVDLHTTNGTWHGYSITYAPGLHTAGHPGTTDYLNNDLFPWLKNRVRQRSGHELFDYGGFYEYPPKDYIGMYPEPRFWTNSFALKNRLAILVETFSHDHFEKRIDSNVALLTALLEYTNDQAAEISDLINQTEQDVVSEVINQGGSLTKGISFDYTNPEKGSLYVYEVLGNSRTGKKKWYSNVNIHLKMAAVKEAIVPRAYVFSAELTHVAEKLEEHGIELSQLSQEVNYQGEEYTVLRLNKQNQNYQGHRLASLEGSFENANKSFPAGSYYVDMAQPLAYLIFYLLEPEADDGLVTWNYFDDYLESRGVGANRVSFPVFKILSQGSSSDRDLLDILAIHYNADLKRVIIASLPDGVQDARLELINQNGQIVLFQKLPRIQQALQIDVSGLNMGIYLLRISIDQQVVTRKILIRNQE